jgi:type IV secretory pathway VirB2 component (pilin)
MAVVSVFDPATGSAIGSATGWISSTLLGSVGTSVAVISIAWLGFEMLGGRLSVHRGVTIILGCFILFGAPSIAAAFMQLARNQAPTAPLPTVDPSPAPSLPSKAPPASDPYAGA